MYRLARRDLCSLYDGFRERGMGMNRKSNVLDRGTHLYRQCGLAYQVRGFGADDLGPRPDRAIFDSTKATVSRRPYHHAGQQAHERDSTHSQEPREW